MCAQAQRKSYPLGQYPIAILSNYGRSADLCAALRWLCRVRLRAFRVPSRSLAVARAPVPVRKLCFMGLRPPRAPVKFYGPPRPRLIPIKASIIRIHPRSRDGFTAEPHTVQCTPRGSRHPSPTTVSSRLPPLPSCGSHQSSCGSYAAATTYGRCMHACVVSATVSSYTMWQPPRMADGTQPLVVTPINPIQVAATSHGRKDTGATRKPHVHALVINPNRERASCAESAVAAALLHQIECARCNGMLIIRVEHNENISKRGSPYITRCRNWTYAPLYEQCPACLCRGP